ncbi:MAG: hypothetical protein O2820_08515 [Planctomycetota bacterium]|nr:hypothetical protein [Planctomycetota bacterium]MDA1249253.1 hypothetical protein [Planctomycetota bacterium]
MTPGTKKMLIGSMAVAVLVAVAALADIVTGAPFAGQVMFDVMFLISAGIVGYMGWDTWRELT